MRTINGERREGPVEVFDPPEARMLLFDAWDQCRSEAIAIMPDGLFMDVLSYEPRAGVLLRLLYRHDVRLTSNSPVVRLVRSAFREGSEARTVERLASPMLILDRRIAFLQRSTRNGEQGTVLVREPTVVRELRLQFDFLWSYGWRVDAGDASAAQVGAEPTLAILHMLADGKKDETIARRLGLSVRTCRRRIAALMAQLGAENRFQAGVLVARRGLMGSAPPD